MSPLSIINRLCIIIISAQIASQYIIDLTMTKVKYHDEIISNSQYLNPVDYYTPTMVICIGTPCQQFTVTISTETEYSFILLSENNNQFLNTTNSKTYESLSRRLYTVYQRNLMNGLKSQDILSFPNSNSNCNSFTLPNKFVFIIHKLESWITEDVFSGVFGIKKSFNPDSLDNNIWKSINTMFNQTMIEEPSIAIELNMAKGKGKLYFGEQLNNGNYAKCKGGTYSEGYWICKVNSITFDNGKTIIQGKDVYFDLQSQLISTPVNDALFIFNTIKELFPQLCLIDEKSYMRILVLVCKKNTPIETLPNIQFYFNDDESKENYFEIRLKNLFVLVSTNGGEEALVLKLVSPKIGLVNWIVGMPGFLDNTIVFNNQNGTIGFIPHKELINDNITIDANSILFITTILICISSLIIVGIVLLIIIHYYHFKRYSNYCNKS